MSEHFQILKTTLVIAMMALYAAPAASQTVLDAKMVESPTVSPMPRYEAQYEDNGVQVTILKVFPKYQLKEGQLVAAQGNYALEVLKTGNLPRDTHRVFHSVSDDTAEITLRPIGAGNRKWISELAERQNSSQIFGIIGSVAMLALTRGGGLGSNLSNLGSLRDVAGSGVLKTANFKSDGVNHIPTGDGAVSLTNIIFIAGVKVQHSQKDDSLEETLVLLEIPKEMNGEVLNGKNIGNLDYGKNFREILSRAILKTINIVPATIQKL